MDFDSYFSEIYGDRWFSLREALLKRPEKAVLKNPFSGYADYSLDKASLFPALALDVKRGDCVGDFCSAPGGKLLAMVFSLAPDFDDAKFVANDLSPQRVGRLKAILHDSLPSGALAKIRVTRGDASLWGKRNPEVFDKILLDAPCSGERHLIGSPQELARWSLKGAKRLAIRQHALLCSALDSLKPGGRIVYSTCSISPLENDGVIKRLMESRAGRFQVIRPEVDFPIVPELTKHGWIFLPDRASCGPIYAAVIEKY